MLSGKASAVTTAIGKQQPVQMGDERKEEPPKVLAHQGGLVLCPHGLITGFLSADIIAYANYDCNINIDFRQEKERPLAARQYDQGNPFARRGLPHTSAGCCPTDTRQQEESFVSVAAGVVCLFIGKWLDGHEKKDD